MFAAVCIFVVNWLSVEIPRHIQQAIEALTNSENNSLDILTVNVQTVIILLLVMVIVRILLRVCDKTRAKKVEWLAASYPLKLKL